MTNLYENPLVTRYSSKEMLENFSDDKKFSTWRKLWIALAKAEKTLGLNITQKQIDELVKFQDDINYDVANAREKVVKHDVMAHVYAYGQQCPSAKGIIHLGATSCFVGDNADIVIYSDAIDLVLKKLLCVMDNLRMFALTYKSMPTLGFTHFQPAQLTTVGKRATLWLQDLLMDYNELIAVKKAIKLRGLKGTTGTQASYLELFDGDHEKVKKLESLICEEMGFDDVFAVTGQTYPRKLDSRISNVLSSVAQSAYKFSNDLRLLQNLKEIEEPFAKSQIGSSAMAYKRNPMRSERISALSRFVLSLSSSPAITASTQWFERTLDDSANKRLVIPQGFLAVDAVLNIYINVTSGLVVYPKMIEKRISEELPFMATENILMQCVKNGGDRQELHEVIREFSMMAGEQVKVHGKSNNLIDLIKADERFLISDDELSKTLKSENFIGRAAEQTSEFIEQVIQPILQQNADQLGYKVDMKV
jgi:adenylosuccinate lyase